MASFLFYASDNGITLKGYDAPGTCDEGLVELIIEDPEGDPELTIVTSFCPEGSRNRSHQFYTSTEHLAALVFNCIERAPKRRANMRETAALFAE